MTVVKKGTMIFGAIYAQYVAFIALMMAVACPEYFLPFYQVYQGI